MSTKAGGVGFNLVGANRLLLYDPHWNPANDKQALGRIWREGQTKNVYIYRLLSTGTIEGMIFMSILIPEKIFQRQVTKQALSSTIVDSGHLQKNSFTAEDLKDLFFFNADTVCETHDLLQCEKCGETSAEFAKYVKLLKSKKPKDQEVSYEIHI